MMTEKVDPVQLLPYVILWALRSDYTPPNSIPCYNLTSKEEGFCTFNRTCDQDQVHIGPCIEGSLSLACCKIRAKMLDLRTPVSLEASHNLRKQIVLHESHNLRTPVVAEASHNLRTPVVAEESHNLRTPVVAEESHNLRKPMLPEESHDLRWPVLEEDSHDLRNSVKEPLLVPTVPNSELVSEILDSDVSTESEEATISQVEDGLEIFFQTANASEDFLISRAHESMDNIAQVCGRPGGNLMARLVGGYRSLYLQWPWMISLQVLKENGFRHSCGAALLNHMWAITAAHCVHKLKRRDIRLRLGEHDFNTTDESHPHEDRDLQLVIVHPQFDPSTYKRDLALLRLRHPVRFQGHIAPVCLPQKGDDAAGKMGVVTGWGKLSERGRTPSVLQEGNVPIMSNRECERLYAETGIPERITSNFLCAGDPAGGVDTCKGDSGGPLVVENEEGQWSLVGLVSWGRVCAAPKQPGVYTRITKFIDFINQFITY